MRQMRMAIVVPTCFDNRKSNDFANLDDLSVKIFGKFHVHDGNKADSVIVICLLLVSMVYLY